MDRKLERAPSLTGSVALIVWNSPRRGLFRYLSGEKRRYIYIERERERGTSDTASGCEQTCKRTEHSPALLAIGFDAVTYTQRSGADVAELFIDCFYPVPRFTERRYYLSTWRVVQILYALYFVAAFYYQYFVMIRAPPLRARAQTNIFYFTAARYIILRNNNRYKLQKNCL